MTNYIKFWDEQHILQKTNAYIPGVCKCFKLAEFVSVHFSEPDKHGEAAHSLPGNEAAGDWGMKKTRPMLDSDTVSTDCSIATCWIPLRLANNTSTNYHDQT
jgi:hypothetical protein